MSAGAGQLAVAGLGIGAVAGLSGLGVIATYRVTGVLNVAFGAIGMMGAFLLRAAVRDWGMPTAAAVALILLVFAPLLGLIIDATVFRPLQQRAAGVAAELTAGFGITVLLVGIATAVWGSGARTDAPSLLPAGSVQLGGLMVPVGVLVELGLLATVAAGLVLVTRGRTFGVAIRAVVDDRGLAELSGLPARRLGRLGWAVGCALAAAAGMLLAAQLRLDPVTFTLVLFETLGVVVAARLVNPAVAIAVALATGIGQAELIGVQLGGRPGEVLAAVRSNLFVAVLLVAVWVAPAFQEARERVPILPRKGTLAEHFGGWWPVVALGIAAAWLRPQDIGTAQLIPPLAVVLLSFRALSSVGLISLGQTAFVGAGALVAAWTPRFGLIAAAAAGAVLGLLFALPVARKRPLHLALTTLALATAASRFMFEQPLFTPPLAHRPGFLVGDRTFLLAEAVCLGVVVLALLPLDRGWVGRRLAAIRDSEPAARMLGGDVERIRVLVFAGGAAVAAFGGALWVYAAGAFDASDFDPLRGLIWLAAATAVGISSAPSLILAAAGMVAADAAIPGASAIIVGIAALTVPWLRGEPTSARAAL
ncbi:MAG TPA: ABC transporter permease [Actinocrinis sp.]|nr:ABC transporter permease [Actinocrinis sp.]